MTDDRSLRHRARRCVVDSERSEGEPGATPLFLGFADGFLDTGDPGWYGNHAGQVQVTVDVTVT